MLLSEIQDAIFSRVTAESGLLPVITKHSGDGSYHANNQPYIVLSIVPLDSRERVYCDSVLRSGFILANVYAPDGYGVSGPMKEAEKIVALFPEQLQFEGIETPDPANIKGALKSEKPGWFYTSALIYFEAR